MTKGNSLSWKTRWEKNSYPCSPVTSLVTSLPSIRLHLLEVAHTLTVAPVVRRIKLPTSEPAFVRHSRLKKQEATFIWLKMNYLEANDNVDINYEKGVSYKDGQRCETRPSQPAG